MELTHSKKGWSQRAHSITKGWSQSTYSFTGGWSQITCSLTRGWSYGAHSFTRGWSYGAHSFTRGRGFTKGRETRQLSQCCELFYKVKCSKLKKGSTICHIYCASRIKPQWVQLYMSNTIQFIGPFRQDMQHPVLLPLLRGFLEYICSYAGRNYALGCFTHVCTAEHLPAFF